MGFTYVPSQHVVCGSKTVELGRVTVFLGPNGSGKSRILNDILEQVKRECPEPGQIQFLNGDRRTRLSDQVREPKQRRGAGALGGVFSLKQYNSRKGDSLDVRLNSGLEFLGVTHLEEQTRFEKEFTAARDSDIKPQAPITSFTRLVALFKEQFDIELGITDDRKVMCSRGGSEYSLNDLSEGEKQALVFLLDFFVFSSEQVKFVIVDEPELHLNSYLAESIWKKIEQEFPDATFIYATHAVHFAMRAEVEKVFLVRGEGYPIQSWDSLSVLPSDFLGDLIGSLPGILRYKKILVVEGKKTANISDERFYAELLVCLSKEKGIKCKVMSRGTRSEVESIVKNRGVLADVSSDIVLYGLIDRDFDADGIRKNKKGQHVLSTPLRNLEALLLLPEVVNAVTEIKKIKLDYMRWLQEIASSDGQKAQIKDALKKICEYNASHQETEWKRITDECNPSELLRYLDSKYALCDLVRKLGLTGEEEYFECVIDNLGSIVSSSKTLSDFRDEILNVFE